jgi:hemolysin III
VSGGVQLRDPVSSLSHLFGLVAAVYFTTLLWRLGRGDRVRQLAVACFGLSACLLYAASSAYHAVSGPPLLRNTLQRLDHSAIYVLIAGTYTPIYAVLLRDPLRRRLLLLMWTLAAAGVACKWLLPLTPYAVSVGLYVGMGWTGLLGVVPLFRAVGPRGMLVGMLGGLFYTAGGICDALGWPVLHPDLVRSHEVLHFFDLAGTFCHVIFLVRYVLPYRRDECQDRPAEDRPVKEDLPRWQL